MYAPFFGLTREPFSIAPDPRFLFLSEQHREALAHLLFGVGGGGGFVLLTGEIGAGKTTVCRCFLQQVPPHCSVAYLFNPQFDATELLDAILEEFAIAPVALDAGFKARVDALNRFLLEQHAAGRAAVLVIDEAQGLAPSVLEQLRLLTNLETSERKLLQIILIGQPELRTLLKRPDLEQLAQRVIARYHLGPLDAGETAAYVRHRVLVASLPLDTAPTSEAGAPAPLPGAARPPRSPLPPLPFDDAALAEVHRRTGGVPRRINVLCDRALLGAYARGRSKADAATVAQAAAEVFALDAGTAERPSIRKDAQSPLASHGGWQGVASAWPWALGAGAVAAALAGWSIWVSRAPAPAPSAAIPVSGDPAPGQRDEPNQAAAPATGASGPASGPVVIDAESLLRGAWHDEPSALAALSSWQQGAADRASGRPTIKGSGTFDCGDAGPLRCWRGRQGWPALQQADRPALLALRDPTGQPAWVLLVALESGTARVLVRDSVGMAEAVPVSVPAAVLAGVWGGEFVALWTPPSGWLPADARATEPAPGWAGWLDERLQGHVHAPPGTPWRERVLAFQLAQGLPADGLPGPLTLMRLQRLSGAEVVPGLAGGWDAGVVPPR